MSYSYALTVVLASVAACLLAVGLVRRAIVRYRQRQRYRQARDLLMRLRQASVSQCAERRCLAPHLARQLIRLVENDGLTMSGVGTSPESIRQYVRRAKEGPGQPQRARQWLDRHARSPETAAADLAESQAPEPEIVIEVEDGSAADEDGIIVTEETDVTELVAALPESAGATPAEPPREWRSGLLRIDQAIDGSLGDDGRQRPGQESLFVMKDGEGELALDIDPHWRGRGPRE